MQISYTSVLLQKNSMSETIAHEHSLTLKNQSVVVNLAFQGLIEDSLEFATEQLQINADNMSELGSSHRLIGLVLAKHAVRNGVTMDSRHADTALDKAQGYDLLSRISAELTKPEIGRSYRAIGLIASVNMLQIGATQELIEEAEESFLRADEYLKDAPEHDQTSALYARVASVAVANGTLASLRLKNPMLLCVQARTISPENMLVHSILQDMKHQTKQVS